MSNAKLTPENELTATAKPVTIPNFQIKDKQQLYLLYMPYLKTGGLFIPSPNILAPGTKMLILLSLPDDVIKKTVSGKVVWVTPPNAQMGLAQGVGIVFDDNEQNKALKIQIENLLAGILGKSDQRTQTF